MNGYELSRKWFDWCFENPEKTKPIHTALYFFAVEHCNRLGWKHKFGLPTEMAKEAIGVKSWHTYIAAFNDLVEWGFFELVERSKNQYSSNIIALSNFDEALDEALDKALTKHMTKQVRSTYQSNDSINKLINNITINHKHILDNIEKFEIMVNQFCNQEDKPVDDKNAINIFRDDKTLKSSEEIEEEQNKILYAKRYKDYSNSLRSDSTMMKLGLIIGADKTVLTKLIDVFLLEKGTVMASSCDTKYKAVEYFQNWAKKEQNRTDALTRHSKIMKQKQANQ
jgi:hypothetical protein